MPELNKVLKFYFIAVEPNKITNSEFPSEKYALEFYTVNS